MIVILKNFGGLVVLSLAINGHAAGLQMLHGHVPAAASRLQPLGELSGSTNLQLAIGLPLRNTEALTNLLAQIYDPASPQYRHYLTPDQFARQFGPTEADYQAVADFATANGLKVTATHPNRILIDVSGSVADIERTFHITMRVYQHPAEHRTFFAPDKEPSVDLAVPLLKISGLDNYSLPRPRLKYITRAQAVKARPSGGSGIQGTYMGNDFRAAYVPGITLTGAGQAVGLVQFDGYTPSDISNYEATAGLPSVTLSNVLIDGFNGLPSGNGGEVEVSLDIEMAVSMAPGLSAVILYEAPNSGEPFDDVLNRMATDNAAKQLSCSWYEPNGGPDPVADQIFQEMAAQGQSFVNASGDFDAWTGPIDFPGETPYITQVGGTALTTTGAGGSWSSETVWNWGGGIGSGGGISTRYSIPSWQTNVSMANNKGSTTMRNIPDVALAADNVYVRADGQDLDVGGTSCAAPLWAGFMALVNQQAANYGSPPPGFLNPTIYQIGTSAGYASAFHDITSGDNTSPASPDQFFAVTGYDLCTGWGTPAGQGTIDALALPPASTPPSIISQPEGQTVPAASNVIFSVTATGSPVLQYQWSLNGTNIAAETNALLLLPNVQPDQAGNYSVQITNAFGSITSSNAFLTVEPPIPPVVVTQPQDQIVASGGIGLFNVAVTGTPPSYQWTFDGNAILNATNSSLMLFDVQSSNAGLYAVAITNGAGWTVSSNASLTFLPPATSCQTDSNGLVGWWAAEGNTYNAADGTYGGLVGGLTFAPGEIGQAFSFNGTNAAVEMGQSSNLSVGAASGFTIETWINPADVTHNYPLLEWGISIFPGNGLMLWISIPTVEGGNGPGSLTLDVVDLGANQQDNFISTPGGFIQSNSWQHVAATYDKTSGLAALYIDGSLISETNLGTLNAWTTENLWLGYDPVSTNWAPRIFGAQQYYKGLMDEVLVYNRALSSDEILATFNSGNYGLCPLPVTSVTIQPTNQTVLVGNTATFTAKAKGSQPWSFQWYYNSTIISGATNGVLTLTNAQLNQSGDYAVQVYNSNGSVLSSNAVLVVDLPNPPVITAQPTNQAAGVGAAVIFGLTVTGTAPLNYQWMFNGSDISGATNASLILSNVSFLNKGLYSVSITNVVGSAVSSNAVLTVYPGWTRANAPVTNWSCVASSADGSKLVAGVYGGTIYSSTDSGSNWAPTQAPSGSWYSIASSADGSKLVAADYGASIYVSLDSGATWTKSTAPSPNSWRAVTCSSDGHEMVGAIYTGLIYLSTNSGSTWTRTTAPTSYWTGLASSADGHQLVAVALSDLIYLSTNSGATWMLVTNSVNHAWSAVASSADGTRLFATAPGSGPAGFQLAGVFASTNSGVLWTPPATNVISNPSAVWHSVACSADASTVVVVDQAALTNGQVYISSDSGNTWRNAGVPFQPWSSVASSADGTKLVAVAGGTSRQQPGMIYIWRPAPSLASAISTEGLTLSWPQSWTGYTLQENPNLTTTNWTDVPASAILTNGQIQVVISPTNAQNFYRLEFHN